MSTNEVEDLAVVHRAAAAARVRLRARADAAAAAAKTATSTSNDAFGATLAEYQSLVSVSVANKHAADAVAEQQLATIAAGLETELRAAHPGESDEYITCLARELAIRKRVAAKADAARRAAVAAEDDAQISLTVARVKREERQHAAELRAHAVERDRFRRARAARRPGVGGAPAVLPAPRSPPPAPGAPAKMPAAAVRAAMAAAARRFNDNDAASGPARFILGVALDQQPEGVRGAAALVDITAEAGSKPLAQAVMPLRLVAPGACGVGHALAAAARSLLEHCTPPDLILVAGSGRWASGGAGPAVLAGQLLGLPTAGVGARPPALDRRRLLSAAQALVPGEVTQLTSAVELWPAPSAEAAEAAGVWASDPDPAQLAALASAPVSEDLTPEFAGAACVVVRGAGVPAVLSAGHLVSLPRLLTMAPSLLRPDSAVFTPIEAAERVLHDAKRKTTFSPTTA